MATNLVPTPYYPLRDVRALVRADKIWVRPNAKQTAFDDFGWRRDDIKRCLLKLNDRYHADDRQRNHFHKHEPHDNFPNTMMDYYKAINIMERNNVYTHFYIHSHFGTLTISSFKEL